MEKQKDTSGSAFNCGIEGMPQISSSRASIVSVHSFSRNAYILYFYFVFI